MQVQKVPLPIDEHLPAIVRAIADNPVLALQAEPGAGKTTRVPSALIDAGIAEVIVLEPRRLAARLAARRVASERNEPLGETVGYRVRFEEASSELTRLWFFTEGVFTRRMLDKPRDLSRMQVLILDEFHERHAETDLAWALTRRLRPEVRVVLMSATLPPADLPLMKIPGRVHPVEVQYTPHSAAPLEQQVLTEVERVLQKQSGHVLVFLPGAAEIRRTISACQPAARAANARLLPLHGDLSVEEQDAAVLPSTARKIICSTNIAESSVTIDGVDAVIDSGLARVVVHSEWSGLSHLEIQKISKNSAIQRAGRAGRTRPGMAVRLYPETDFVRRPDDLAPEILRVELSEIVLRLRAAGLDPQELPWFNPPPQSAWQAAEELLRRLDADATMAALGLHPRLAKFVLSAASKDEACDIAAKLSDGRLRLSASGRFASDVEAILATEPALDARRLSKQLRSQLRRTAACSTEQAVLLAFPDRVARRRGDTLLLSNGASTKLHASSATRSEFLAAIEFDGSVRIASPIEPDWLLEFFPERITTQEELVWNREGERVEQVQALRYDELTIDESRSRPKHGSELLVQKALEAGIERFVDAEEFGRWQRRVHFAAEHANFTMPEIRDALAAIADGLTSFDELREVAGSLIPVLESKLPMRLIDEIAPSHISLASGRRARIEYHEDRPPSVASRLQDFFGMQETPRVARGSVPLVIQLLAPSQRPVQVTTDLPSFWKNFYPQVRRELMRRYPKHKWPEDPTTPAR